MTEEACPGCQQQTHNGEYATVKILTGLQDFAIHPILNLVLVHELKCPTLNRLGNKTQCEAT